MLQFVIASTYQSMYSYIIFLHASHICHNFLLFYLSQNGLLLLAIIIYLIYCYSYVLMVHCQFKTNPYLWKLSRLSINFWFNDESYRYICDINNPAKMIKSIKISRFNSSITETFYMPGGENTYFRTCKQRKRGTFVTFGI